MRKLFHEYNESISPKFLEIDTFEGEKTIKKIEKKLEYPIMIKPTNICQSKLVTKNYHREELLSSLKNIYKKGNIVQRIRDDLLNKKDTHFQVLAEEFIEGNMYSIDGLVDRNGKIFCYPPVYVKTGKNAGYDDFFGYLQMTPTKLSKNHKSIKKIEDIIQKTIEALSLKNSHFHIELLKSDEDG
jgi:D-alanine-D-alanine ligase-like ATP-grasp enzyme